MGISRFASTAIKDATAAGISWLTGSVGPSDVVQIADLDTPNNPPSLNEDGHLVGTWLQRTGTDAEINAITLGLGELAYTTDTLEIRIGDGVTPGGIFYSAKWQRVANVVANHATSSTTLTNISGISLSYKADAEYRIKFVICGSDAGSASNWKFSLAGSTGWKVETGDALSPVHPMTWWADYRDNATYESKTIVRPGSILGGVAAMSILPVVAAKATVYLHGVAEIRTLTAGAFTLKAAQLSSSASALSVGASLEIQRIA